MKQNCYTSLTRVCHLFLSRTILLTCPKSISNSTK